ncbi:hypothetical protein D3C79_1084420 [compost metagenome]
MATFAASDAALQSLHGPVAVGFGVVERAGLDATRRSESSQGLDGGLVFGVF